MPEIEQAETPQDPTWKGWLLAVAIIGGLLAFGTYAAIDPAAAHLLSVMNDYNDRLYVGGTLLAGVVWLVDNLFKQD